MTGLLKGVPLWEISLALNREPGGEPLCEDAGDLPPAPSWKNEELAKPNYLVSFQ